ncbi:MAG: acyl-CoA dehydrogenase [Naasia sp.]
MTDPAPALIASPDLGASPVLLGPTDELDVFAAEAAAVAGRVDPALALARKLTSVAPKPGEGETLRLWRLLASLAAGDLTAARVVEAHLDALAVLEQSGADGADRTWGVFAAEAAGVRLDATWNGTGWELDGTKPWCSLAGRLDAALVTAHTSGGSRRLFAVSLTQPGVVVERGAWHSRGLAAVDSGPVSFSGSRAEPVGADGWYLERPGFSWGGIGVAACWYGGAVGVARALLRAAERREPDQLAAAHLGAVDAALVSARALLVEAAAAVDGGGAQGEEGSRLALRVRRVVAQAAEQVIVAVGHSLGPAPLALDEDHARRVADLTVYIRQEHAERDAAALGRATVSSHQAGAPVW